MAHRNAEKGKRWERWCARFLHIARRGNVGAHLDLGDLDDPDFIYECKDDRSRSPLQWWEQAEAARFRAVRPWSLVLAKHSALAGKPKRPGEPEGWAFQSIEQWRIMREYIRWLESFTDPGIRARALRRIREDLQNGLADDPMPIPLRPHSDREGKSGEGDLLVPGRRSNG